MYFISHNIARREIVGNQECWVHRKGAKRVFPANHFALKNILTNCRTYPKDEAPAAYKDFNEVLNSVRLAGLASEVARLRARFVIKDSDDSLKGAA